MSGNDKGGYTAWAEIDLKALRHNFRVIKRLMRGREVERRAACMIPAGHIRTPKILSVVKADAYGHGMIKAAKALDKAGTDFFGVSEFSEGVVLRKNRIKKPVLVLEPPLASFVKPLVDHRLTATVASLDIARALSAYAGSIGKKADIHINVDTGMGRLGIAYDEAEDLIKQVMCLPHLAVTGLYTHFPSADTNRAFTEKQISRMAGLVNRLDRQGLIIPYIHGANSMGATGYQTGVFNLVRLGLILYGLYPSSACRKILTLKPVMSVKSRVIFVKTAVKGSGISYGRTFVADRNMTTATIALGYNDGYFRVFSNKAYVLIRGRRCQVLGRVTMDQIVVDVTGVPNVKAGAEAVIIGEQKRQEISADDLARHAGTINYEIVCALGNRLSRIYKR